ncbi:HNH endonuclease family protein [Pontibacter flavimaris]|uniref:TIGR02646 family protein n=1 Tax=Pontibacter flavimaris TaxID=1797110 RepID=A0A1Q5PIP1_9BACT|nr:hypothetical protein [Pontibacter flavimaris]OKL42067.1 hypothetical protein A3841_08705 [Pontibacter flavimaris]
MIHLKIPLVLGEEDQTALQALQQKIDEEANYGMQVSRADKLWESKPKALFQRVRSALEENCPGARRCNYCEDSLADEIEHIRPKSWFPDQAFDPANYLFACGPCNGPKNSAYAVVDANGKLTHAIRDRQSPVTLPPAGQEALLHPRMEDPLAYLSLDLSNTFRYEPIPTLNPVQEARAIYTRDILKINKDPLCVAREEAFQDFAARLKSYYLATREQEPESALLRYRNELLKKQHISVWREMQRQSALLPNLRKLFELVPNALHW